MDPGPWGYWMLTPKTITPPGLAPGKLVRVTARLADPQTCYVLGLNLAGLYTSPDRHSDNTIAAI
jgi:hypothetical protein